MRRILTCLPAGALAATALPGMATAAPEQATQGPALRSVTA
ncbi:hypothetical protein [Catellatospora methionotrophica]|nr:hypothetical protein [Catellatospora methionotrophica]